MTRILGFVERYLLACFYLYLAWGGGAGVLEMLANQPVDPGQQGRWLVEVIGAIDVFAISLFIGLLLFCSRPPVEGPRQWREVVVPLAVSTFFMAYRLQRHFPAALREPLVSLRVQVPCALASPLVGALGSLLALWGVLSLGRSFGIFVAVRQVVLAGPYQYVRHPIYSGYLLIWLGMILAHLSLGVLILVAMHVSLMIYRAKLEERRLAEASPEYAAYRLRTGFLFPRLG